jgi:hypothetical protein
VGFIAIALRTRVESASGDRNKAHGDGFEPWVSSLGTIAACDFRQQRSREHLGAAGDAAVREGPTFTALRVPFDETDFKAQPFVLLDIQPVYGRVRIRASVQCARPLVERGQF